VNWWWTLLLLLCTSCVTHADQLFIQEQFEAIVGDIQETPTRPTIRQAAKEYIAGRQLAASSQHMPAIAHFRRAAELDEYSPAPWAGMAISLGVIGRQKSAIVAWNEVLIRDGTHKDALLILGIDAARLGQVEKGKRTLAQHWLTKEATPVEALLRIAALLSVFESNQKLSDALQETVGAVVDEAMYDLVPDATTPTWLGVIQQLVDLNAEEIAFQLVSQASTKVQRRELGTLLTVLPVLEESSGGDGSMTQHVYEQIATEQRIPLAPRWYEPVSLSEALSIAAQSMSIIGEEAIAPIRLYNASLELNPTNPLALNNLAWMLLKRDGPTQEVQQLCEKAIALDSSAPYILDTVGWVYVLLGDAESAIPLFVRALKGSNSPSVETLDHLGDAYWIAGEIENAIQAWRAASTILNGKGYRQGVLDGYMRMAHTVWGISVVSPEALYDFELGDLTRRLEDKLSAIQEGRTPSLGLEVKMNGAE
jgi:tetratricopeptide (TPR) repeat protein